jgi:hypothetical protein
VGEGSATGAALGADIAASLDMLTAARSDSDVNITIRLRLFLVFIVIVLSSAIAVQIKVANPYIPIS